MLIYQRVPWYSWWSHPRFLPRFLGLTGRHVWVSPRAPRPLQTKFVACNRRRVDKWCSWSLWGLKSMTCHLGFIPMVWKNYGKNYGFPRKIRSTNGGFPHGMAPPSTRRRVELRPSRGRPERGSCQPAAVCGFLKTPVLRRSLGKMGKMGDAGMV